MRVQTWRGGNVTVAFGERVVGRVEVWNGHHERATHDVELAERERTRLLPRSGELTVRIGARQCWWSSRRCRFAYSTGHTKSGVSPRLLNATKRPERAQSSHSRKTSTACKRRPLQWRCSTSHCRRSGYQGSRHPRGRALLRSHPRAGPSADERGVEGDGFTMLAPVPSQKP